MVGCLPEKGRMAGYMAIVLRRGRDLHGGGGLDFSHMSPRGRTRSMGLVQ